MAEMEKVPCSRCSKTGHIVCPSCKGSGKIGNGPSAKNCRQCGGGSILSGSGKKPCNQCQATGYVYRKKR